MHEKPLTSGWSVGAGLWLWGWPSSDYLIRTDLKGKGHDQAWPTWKISPAVLVF